MTAHSSAEIRAAAASGLLDRPVVELGRWLAAAVAGSLGLAALLVGWRRLAGELTAQPPPLLLCVGVLVVVVTAGIRILWRRLPAGSASSRSEWLNALLPSVALLALGAALSVPGTAPWELAGFWALLAGEETWAWRPAAWRALRHRQESSTPPPAPSPRIDAAQPPSRRPSSPAAAVEVPPDDVLQQLTRSQAADGSQQLAGWLRVRFAAGQRTASEHVEFCPPFPRTPEILVEQVDGPPARVKTAQLLPYGARLELKLAAPAERPLGVLLQFTARSKAEPSLAGPPASSSGNRP